MKLTEEQIKVYRGRFSTQRSNALRRGVGWELEFEEWLQIWQDSGKLAARGSHPDQYVMARNGPDIGAYKVGNVTIKTGRENCREIVQPEDKSERMSAINKGVPKTDAHKAAISAACKGRPGNKGRSKQCEVLGVVYPTVTEAGKALGVERTTVLNRINRGWPGYKLLD